MKTLRTAFYMALALATAGLIGLLIFAAGKRGPRDAGWRWEPIPPPRSMSGPPRLPPAAVAAAVAVLALLIGSLTIVALDSGGSDKSGVGQPQPTQTARAVEQRPVTTPGTAARPAATAPAVPTPTAQAPALVRDVGSGGTSGRQASGVAVAPGGSSALGPVSGPPVTRPGVTTPTAQPKATPKITPAATPTPLVTPLVTPTAASAPLGNPLTPRPVVFRPPVLEPTPTATPSPHPGSGGSDDEDDSSDCGHDGQAGGHAKKNARSGSASCHDDDDDGD